MSQHGNERITTRRLGKNGPEVSAIGLGCMGMSDFYGDTDEAKSIETLHHALDIGVNFWDTADMYGTGKNEQLLSKVLKDRRDEVVLATKFAILRGDDGAVLGISGRPEYVTQACDASLKRLGVDHIDLYYQHRVDPQTPIEDTVGAMSRLVESGKVRDLGLSEAAPATLRRANGVHPITALQTEYSLWSRDVEGEILPTCRELGIGLVPYSPLGRGFLTGRFRSLDDLAPDDWRRHNPRFQGENFELNLRLADKIRDMAETRGCTAAQLALAWLLAQGEDIVPIPGTRSAKRLEENAAAANVKLSQADVAEIAGALPPVEGTRYPEASMAVLNG